MELVYTSEKQYFYLYIINMICFKDTTLRSDLSRLDRFCLYSALPIVRFTIKSL